LISQRAVIKVFQILFAQIHHSSSLNLYSNNSLTSHVSLAKAQIQRLISPGGNTPYLSLITHVVPHESVIAIIAAKFFSSSVSDVFNQYNTLKVQAHHHITVIFSLLLMLCFSFKFAFPK